MQTIRHNPILKVSRVTGILFLLSLLVPVFNWTLILSKFVSKDGSTSLNTLSSDLLLKGIKHITTF